MSLDLIGAELIGDDSWLTVHSAGDYKNAVSQLKASADNLNLTAANEPGWKPVYDNALRLYRQYYDVSFLSSINPFGDQLLNNAAWNAITDCQRRVDEFAEHMRSKGRPVVEPKHKPIDDSLLPTDPSAFTKYLPWLIGGAIVVGVGAVAVPIIVPIIAATRKQG